MSTVIKPFADLITTNIKPDFTGGYRIYSALLSQAATNAPVADVKENNIGEIVWSRSTVGVYYGILVDAFVNGKTVLDLGPLNSAVTSPDEIQISRFSKDAITIQTSADGDMQNQLVTIKIYQ